MGFPFLPLEEARISTSIIAKHSGGLCNEGSLKLRDTESPAQIWKPGWLVCSLGLMVVAGVHRLWVPHLFIRDINTNPTHTQRAGVSEREAENSLLIGTIH